jgi:hypothetical protein
MNVQEKRQHGTLPQDVRNGCSGKAWILEEDDLHEK